MWHNQKRAELCCMCNTFTTLVASSYNVRGKRSMDKFFTITLIFSNSWCNLHLFPPPHSHGLHALPAVLIQWVSPAVTASPYGTTLASSGAAVICGGTPLVIENLHNMQFTQLNKKKYCLCTVIPSFCCFNKMCHLYMLISVHVAFCNTIKLIL